ncbi:hypothetical protein GC174_15095 [bacterium]|nr:hypothetical protein [bacterium]
MDVQFFDSASVPREVIDAYQRACPSSSEASASSGQPCPELAHAYMSFVGARKVAEHIERKPSSNIVFAWGQSPRLMYSILRQLNLDWSGLGAFIGDDYEEERIGESMLKEMLFSRTNLQSLSIYSPLDHQGFAYDRFIKGKGGIDLAILGLGPNGHILFNEPGETFSTNTHRVFLSESTIGYNEANYGRRLESAHTMGLLSILRCREVLLLISGSHKKEIARKVLYGDVAASVPATVLRKHPRVTVLVDFDLL